MVVLLLLLAVTLFTHLPHRDRWLKYNFKGISMSHFAKVENGTVTQVIVVEQDVIDTGMFGSGWIQTSYNTRGGVHYDQNNEPSEDQSRALRKNYAGVGYTYDSERDAFIPPQPYASWVLDDASCLWTAPVAMPSDDKQYNWDEETKSWVEFQNTEQA
jgi:hypothetical protein